MVKSLALTLCLVFGITRSADLNISGQNGKTYDGGTYGKCVISNSQNITVKNCKFSTTANVVLIQNSSKNITVENCDIDGQNETCQAVYIKGGCSYITIKNNEIYNIADDGICMVNSNNIKILGNEIHHLIGKGTDAIIPGPCYNGHSDGIEINEVADVEIAGNLLYDIKSTSAMILAGWSGTNYRMNVYNNICYTPDVGFGIYVRNQRNTTLHHNTVWGAKNGGIALLGDNQGLTIKNNLLKSINFAHGGGAYNPAVHDFGYNLVALWGASQDYDKLPTDVWAVNPVFANTDYTMSKPATAVDPNGFKILSGSPAINKGTTSITVPSTDFFGNPRDSQPDLGAIEYQGGTSIEDIKEHMWRTAGVEKFVYGMDGKFYGKNPVLSQLPDGVYVIQKANGEINKKIVISK